MFKVRAEFREDLEIGAGRERVREFFGDLENFVRLMPGVESIGEEAEGVLRWTVCVDVGLVGTLRGSFRIVQIDNQPLRIEWGPAPDEKKNLLRYGVSFEARSPTETLVRVAQRVELRRQRASELHLMAGLLGERRVSASVQERVNQMMTAFLKRARAQLES